MFTGIITDVGTLQKKENELFTFTVTDAFCKKLGKGTSVAINGACMTVVGKPTTNSFSVEIMPESQKKTMLGDLKDNAIVNLELPATVTTFLSGHVVQGHVDQTGTITNMTKDGISTIITIEVPEAIKKYIVTKGSITVNGISLTVIDIIDTRFTVGIIPFTWEHTMLHTVKIDDRVNIETDILARYIEKVTQKDA